MERFCSIRLERRLNLAGVARVSGPKGGWGSMLAARGEGGGHSRQNMGPVRIKI